MEHKCPDYIDEHETISPALDQSIIWMEKDNAWYAGNIEYGTQVKFCPWCGLDLNTLHQRTGG